MSGHCLKSGVIGRGGCALPARLRQRRRDASGSKSGIDVEARRRRTTCGHPVAKAPDTRSLRRLAAAPAAAWCGPMHGRGFHLGENAVEVVGFRRLQRRERLVRLELLQPQLLADRAACSSRRCRRCSGRQARRRLLIADLLDRCQPAAISNGSRLMFSTSVQWNRICGPSIAAGRRRLGTIVKYIFQFLYRTADGVEPV